MTLSNSYRARIVAATTQETKTLGIRARISVLEDADVFMRANIENVGGGGDDQDPGGGLGTGSG